MRSEWRTAGCIRSFVDVPPAVCRDNRNHPGDIAMSVTSVMGWVSDAAHVAWFTLRMAFWTHLGVVACLPGLAMDEWRHRRRNRRKCSTERSS